jgi:hypothetical protein
MNALPRAQGRGWDFSMLSHNSHKVNDVLQNTRMRQPVPLMQLCDNEGVVRACCGDSILQSVSPHVAAVRKVRWHWYAFEHRWRCEPFVSDSPLLLHIPRELNRHADLLCNLMLDNNLCESELIERVHVPWGAPVALYSDGAARSNPGPAACAAIVQLHVEGVWRTVAFSALALGCTSSVTAEFEGVCLAQELFVRFCITNGLCS